MIVCTCRNINEKDYKNEIELYNRLIESDKKCEICIKYYQNFFKKQEKNQCIR